MKVTGFKPLFDEHCTTLILGSFPSIKSRQQNFYYGNKQNRFWPLLTEAFGGSAQTVEEKTQLCLQNHIALWDIVTECEIEGSMDADIKNFVLADLSVVLQHCHINKILCNGAKAYQLTQMVCSLPIKKMPSTSPANVRFNKAVWLEELKKEN